MNGYRAGRCRSADGGCNRGSEVSGGNSRSYIGRRWVGIGGGHNPLSQNGTLGALSALDERCYRAPPQKLQSVTFMNVYSIALLQVRDVFLGDHTHPPDPKRLELDDAIGSSREPALLAADLCRS